jgi:hypothetical protein
MEEQGSWMMDGTQMVASELPSQEARLEKGKAAVLRSALRDAQRCPAMPLNPMYLARIPAGPA